MFLQVSFGLKSEIKGIPRGLQASWNTLGLFPLWLKGEINSHEVMFYSFFRNPAFGQRMNLRILI